MQRVKEKVGNAKGKSWTATFKSEKDELNGEKRRGTEFSN
jgi:hypothetical protein